MKTAYAHAPRSTLQIEPKHWLSGSIDIRSSGRSVARMELSYFFREQGTAKIGEETFTLRQAWPWSRTLTMEGPGGTSLCAERSGFFRTSFAFDHEGERYVLQRRHWWGHEYDLCDAAGMVLGSMRPDGFFMRRATAELPDDLPLFARVFAIWLVWIAWRLRRRAELS